MLGVRLARRAVGPLRVPALRRHARRRLPGRRRAVADRGARHLALPAAAAGARAGPARHARRGRHPADRGAPRRAGRRLLIKNEAQNPTASFKDRPVAVAATMARELGLEGLLCASTGNTAAAVAAYGARAGLPVRCLVPAGTPAAKLAQARAAGARVVLVNGTYSDAHALAARAAERFGWANLTSTYVNPYMLEGDKTLGLELWEQLGGRTPDWVVVPVGAGPLLAAVGKAWDELGERGPRLMGVQASGCAPIVRAFEAEAEHVSEWEGEIEHVRLLDRRPAARVRGGRHAHAGGHPAQRRPGDRRVGGADRRRRGPPGPAGGRARRARRRRGARRLRAGARAGPRVPHRPHRDRRDRPRPQGRRRAAAARSRRRRPSTRATTPPSGRCWRRPPVADLHIALVGLGRFGRLHAETLRGLPGCRLAAICDADPEVLERCGERVGSGRSLPRARGPAAPRPPSTRWTSSPARRRTASTRAWRSRRAAPCSSRSRWPRGSTRRRRSRRWPSRPGCRCASATSRASTRATPSCGGSARPAASGASRW